MPPRLAIMPCERSSSSSPLEKPASNGQQDSTAAAANLSGWFSAYTSVPEPPIDSPAMKLSSRLSDAGNQLYTSGISSSVK